MEHAHELYLKAIAYVCEGGKNSIKQYTIGKGKTYYSKEWNLKQKIKLVLGMRKFNKLFVAKDLLEKKENVRTIKI